jgi:hypothetical protein
MVENGKYKKNKKIKIKITEEYLREEKSDHLELMHVFNFYFLKKSHNLMRL